MLLCLVVHAPQAACVIGENVFNFDSSVQFGLLIQVSIVCLHNKRSVCYSNMTVVMLAQVTERGAFLVAWTRG